MTETLYAARGGGQSTSNLYTIDPATGVASSIGATGFALTGLAQDPATSIMYGATSSNSGASPKNLVTVNLTTGAATIVGPFNVSGEAMSDICFSSAGQMYGWGSNRNFFTINKVTGQATLVGGPAASDRFAGGLDFIGPTLYHADAFAESPISLPSLSDSGFATSWGDSSAHTRYASSAGFAVTVLVSQFRVILSKQGSPTDDVVFEVRADSAGSPGSLLFSYTIPNASITSGTILIPVGPGGITFSNPNTYWFVLRRTGAVSGANFYQAEHQLGTSGAFYNGSAWGASGSAQGPAVIMRTPTFTWTVNPSTGGLTQVADYSGYDWTYSQGNIGAGSVRPSDNLMWCCAGDTVDSEILTIDVTTAIASNVGAAGVSRFDAIAWAGAAVSPGLSSPEGLCIAFSAGPLDSAPDWTRLDD